MTDHKKIMSRRLRELVAETGKTYKQLGIESGVGRGILLRTANGQTMPNSEALIGICEFFGVSADYLLGLTEERN